MSEFKEIHLPIEEYNKLLEDVVERSTTKATTVMMRT